MLQAYRLQIRLPNDMPRHLRMRRVVATLLQNLSNQTRSNGPASLSNIEPLSALNGERMCNLADHLDIITRHDHLAVRVFGGLGEVERCGFVCESTILSVDPALILTNACQNVPAVRM